MIAVVGSPVLAPDPIGGPTAVSGLAARIALAAAAAGCEVQLIGKVGEDPAGDAALLALARGGVGHIAVLREPGAATPIGAAVPAPDDESDAPVAALLADDGGSSLALRLVPAGLAGEVPGLPMEAADISLGLRYLRDFRVVVAVDALETASALAAAEAATFADAALVVLAPPGAPIPAAFTSATVLEVPDDDPDGAFAELVGRLAAALDAGQPPADAFRGATDAVGWRPAIG